MRLYTTPNKWKFTVAFLFSFFTLTIITLLLLRQDTNWTIEPYKLDNFEVVEDPLEAVKVSHWWSLRNATNFSVLGEILFLNKPPPNINNRSKNYQILIWKHGPSLENRHIKHFSDKSVDPFEYCSVKNCEITYKDSDIVSSDIVIFHMHKTRSKNELPKDRNPKQIWAFLTDESPYHTFYPPGPKLTDFNGIFNWSMTYRMDSDIPVPYGRTVLRKTNETVSDSNMLLLKRRDVLVAILGSNCGGQNHRWEYVRKLEQYIEVHSFGECGNFKTACPGHFGADCPELNSYIFYLSFENSNCDEYVTEKLWWNAFHKNAIPIVMGSSPKTYKTLLPLNSYINIDDFASPRDLAQYLLRLNETEEFKSFYNWRCEFEIFNEHGYFQSRSYHYCRICEALNYNDRTPKVYGNLDEFWSVNRDCHLPWDSWNDDD
ncbi:glycoprotein 3-alpha-L-fucosyltransferase A-like [Anthonomus grandis grandis]|uniref:glycoprotein 3-alpha-L-fucosyltransferase A-like n=1 Tax=Anthonomus grandis grandis TaxID=2921223 RepID=UPI0021650704|nr:glycoprotein 3-alpha-L-fucosyltransferase A-like [Anthonomus grandis grandis]XP_050298959.1 glycoprotein 3-alpha-L-fucosyltransferase A-like [Anthonomus grandis grandis]